MDLEKTRSHKQFEGFTNFYRHDSKVCNAPMNFAAYLPPQSQTERLPVLYWLSGLSCNEEIFMTEAHAQGLAKKYGVILIVPDTSPRNTGIHGEDDTYDLGSGAGFYVNATQPKWASHYQMESYVTQELIELVEQHLPAQPGRRSLFGHSMGGHGALVLGLRHPQTYRSVSAFAPILVPSKSPWGIKTFTEYLGTDRATWSKYDANALLKTTSTNVPMLIDQGLDDEYLEEQLGLAEFEQTLAQTRTSVELRKHAGYDHSYYFISTFLEDHIAFHCRNLC